MSKNAKSVAALFVVYLFGIATPFLARYTLALIGQAIEGETEFSRKTSPDGVLDAVVVQNHPGAFSSRTYYLYLVPRGGKVGGFSGDPYIVTTSEGDALVADWDKQHFLSVNTGNAHVKFFGNLWYSRKVPDYYVELRLKQTSRYYLKESGKLRGEP